jgi:hypothetical protein
MLNRNVLTETWMGSTYDILHIRENFPSKYVIIFGWKSIRLAYFICADFNRNVVDLQTLFVQNLMLVGFSAVY